MRKRVAFPVGLHGMLLFALCWLTLPGAWSRMQAVAAWRRQPPVLPDRVPAVFAWLA